MVAARDFLPWGSGAGAFPWVYAPREPLADMVQVYAERAHNDVLQVLVEAGIPGGLLLASFAALLAAAGLGTILMARARVNRDDPLPSVAFVAACVPLVHALVDYPLRTFGVAISFALLLAVVLGSRRDIDLPTRADAG
jgi:O-antigen ligase